MSKSRLSDVFMTRTSASSVAEKRNRYVDEDVDADDDDSSVGEDSILGSEDAYVLSNIKDDDQLDELRIKHRASSTPSETTKKRGTGDQDLHSDDYDTDLEEDFAPPPETPADNTGKYIYLGECKKTGIIPASFIVRNLDGGHFCMKYRCLGGEATKPLAEALKTNTLCEEINLTDNYIEATGASALADVLKENMFIVNINVSHNFIRSKGVGAFCDMLECNTTLKTLSLRGNQLTDKDAKRIAEALKNNMSLNCIDLSHNQFGEEGGVYLGAGVAANIGLADLDLSWNGIRQKGAEAIGKAIGKNIALEVLDLSWNGMACSGASALAQSLKINKFLRVLDLSNNRIGEEGAKMLGEAFAKNQRIETVMLAMNPIGDAGVDAILKGISGNNVLKLVGLEDIAISPTMLAKIKELQAVKDVLIMHTHGSPQQSRINQSILAMFDRFISENADRLEDLFNQMDKDKSGAITLEEFKYGLRDFGLRLTSKQLDLLLEELDEDKSGTIEFDELMNGSSLVQQEKQKMENAEKDAMLYKAGGFTVNPATTPSKTEKK